MAYTSGRFKLFKPGPTDLVDPLQDMQYNFNIGDKAIFGLTSYKYSISNVPDITGMDYGYKVLDQKSGRIKYVYLDPTLGLVFKNIPKVNNVNPWNAITFLSGWANNDAVTMSACSWRYCDNDTTRVELKGRFTNAIIANNTTTLVTGNDAVPRPVADKLFSVQPGNGVSNTENNNAARIHVTSTGAIAVVHYGTSMGGAIENYFCIDNIFYTTN